MDASRALTNQLKLFVSFKGEYFNFEGNQLEEEVANNIMLCYISNNDDIVY